MMKGWIRRLQRHARQWWYAPVIGVLAFIDHFTVVIPTDGLVISAVLLNPRRWVYTFLVVAVFSSLGAMVFSGAIQIYGLHLLQSFSPGLDQTGLWQWTMNFMTDYGALALFGIALSPIMQHPALALAAVTGFSLGKIFLIVLSARLIKYGLYCWIASHMPHLVRRLWGVRDELKVIDPVDALGIEGTKMGRPGQPRGVGELSDASDTNISKPPPKGPTAGQVG